MAAVLTYVGSNSSASAATVFTFVAQAIGTAAADRIVLTGMMAGGGSDNNFTAISVQGISGALATTCGPAGSLSLAVGYTPVPTGTTGDVVMTLPATKNRAAVSVWNCTGTAATPTSTARSGSDTTASVNTVSAAVTVPSGGFFVAQGGTNNVDSTGLNWTNATERDDIIAGGSARSSGADGTASATISFVTANAATMVLGLVSMAWGPAASAGVGAGLTQGILLDRRSLVA